MVSADQKSVLEEVPATVDLTDQQQELNRLREQQALLKKIVDQQKEVCSCCLVFSILELTPPKALPKFVKFSRNNYFYKRTLSLSSLSVL